MAALDPTPEAVDRFPEQLARRFEALPVRVEPDGTLVLAFADPTNLQVADDVLIVLGEPLLIGEVRDEETAATATRAAMTGHLVPTSLHAHNAAAAIVRLRDMGVEPGLLASSLNRIVAQRLARRLCLACREPYRTVADEVHPGLGADDVTLYRSRGCSLRVLAGVCSLEEVARVTGDRLL